MKISLRCPLSLLMVAFLAPVILGQNDPASQAGAGSKAEAPEVNYQVVVFVPDYRFVSTSGFAGRVGEYDSLQQSVGGEISLTWLDYTQHISLKNHGQLISQDDYDIDTQFKIGKLFSFSMTNRSFLRHLDDVPYGTNLSPDDMIRTNVIPDGARFGIKRTMNTANVRLKIPDSPITLFAKGGWQARSGVSQLQYFDMGGDTSCGSCHPASQYRNLNYTTRNVAGGAELKIAHTVITYEHDYRSFNDRLLSPSDFYGSTIGTELPAGVPETLAGYYTHNVLSRHDTQLDTVRVHAPLISTLTFNGNVSYGRTTNLFTNNPQNSLNGDASLTWNSKSKLHTILDFHQQNTINEFTPFFALFGDPSIHRWWAGARAEYSLTSMFELEAHYRRTDVTRSGADLWQLGVAYSPTSQGLVGTSADAFVPRIVPATFSNTLGFGVRFHRGETWNLRSGYEWIGTHAPGYLTDPQTSHRVFAGGSYTPRTWLTFTEDFSVLRQADFLSATLQPFPRSNRLYLNTSNVVLRPVTDWSLSLGYAYYQNNLRSDLMYGGDPLYPESLVPFKAIGQSYSVSSSYLLKKKLAWTVELAHVSASSSLRPDLSVAPLCTAGPVPITCAISTAFASQFSTVGVPQALASSTVDYKWRGGFDSGLRYQYGSYRDEVNPGFDGHLSSYTAFLGKSW